MPHTSYKPLHVLSLYWRLHSEWQVVLFASVMTYNMHILKACTEGDRRAIMEALNPATRLVLSEFSETSHCPCDFLFGLLVTTCLCPSKSLKLSCSASVLSLGSVIDTLVLSRVGGNLEVKLPCIITAVWDNPGKQHFQTQEEIHNA